MASEEPKPGLRFSRTFDAGHLIIGSSAIAGFLMGAVAGYVAIQQTNANVQQEFAREDTKIELIQQRLDQDEKTIYDMRGALDKISSQLADLRTLIAGLGNGKR